MAIQVKNLIEELQQINPEHYVLLSSDSEGNTFNFLQGIAINQKLSDGSIYLAELSQDLEDAGFTEEDVRTDGVDCVVFYPQDDDTLRLEKIILSSK